MRASKAAEKKVRTGLLQARDSRNPAQTDFRGENGQSNSIRRKHGQEAKYPVGGQSVPRCLRRSVRSDRLRFSIRKFFPRPKSRTLPDTTKPSITRFSLRFPPGKSSITAASRLMCLARPIAPHQELAPRRSRYRASPPPARRLLP